MNMGLEAMKKASVASIAYFLIKEAVTSLSPPPYLHPLNPPPRSLPPPPPRSLTPPRFLPPLRSLSTLHHVFSPRCQYFSLSF